MRICAGILNDLSRPRLTAAARLRPSARSLLTLAIETSCDDTSVAVLEKQTVPENGKSCAILHFHKKITSNNTLFQGVHPLVSLQSHQENLAKLVDDAVFHLPSSHFSESRENNDGSSKPLVEDLFGRARRRRPDFISVTRGPGMRANLSEGVATAKGLAAAWQVNLVGVHHMQAHALTPRLVAALQNAGQAPVARDKATCPGKVNVKPEFPFLSVLASGGHTLLIHSASLTDHQVLASTTDIAVGECLDKIARVVLPPDLLQTTRSTMYGALLEKFVFSGPSASGAGNARHSPEIENIASEGKEKDRYRLDDRTASDYCAIYGTRADYGYVVPKNNEEAKKQNITKWGWAFNQPLSKAAGGLKNKSLEMSFSGLLTAVEHVVKFEVDQRTGKRTQYERSVDSISLEERKDIAREAMRAAFEHVVGRVVLGLQQASAENPGQTPVSTVVMAGGVAANSYLRYILASVLVARGFPDVRIVFPPPSLCTDNAAMIAWAGIEMYEAGYHDPRTIRAIRKWPLNQLLSPPDKH
ncbi:hypothetical protein CC78DRAFT_573239 [Lojkania enalia]|uniref:Gcp-like domain-containing protein n=1 Tax=Lojkania enalia TaxID=147567 RepID=A0A9P4TS02_9PLEO|nr:hypothetical protein CC78DRAFT_573239 [Didymosphaeria enalia]